MSSAPFYIQQFLLSEVTERARWQDHASLSLHFANRRQPTNTASGEMWGRCPDPSYLCGPGQQVCAERLPRPRAGARAVNWPFQQKPPGPRGGGVRRVSGCRGVVRGGFSQKGGGWFVAGSRVARLLPCSVCVLLRPICPSVTGAPQFER